MTRVLVVDDDFMVARVHSRFVERTPDHEVVGVASSGEQALALAAELDPDLVLLDVHLPDMSGLEVLRGLRERGIAAGVVMVTAERDAAVVREALLGGALQYVVKPFEYEDLAERLRRVSQAIGSLPTGEADQASIDRAFGSTAGRSTTSLPKGFSPETVDVVLGVLAEGDDVSAAECADRAGIARVTARRYLELLVDRDRARVSLRYGVAGRPERRYRSP